MLLFEGESPDAAKRFANADPYVRNGLVRRWEVRKWATVVGAISHPRPASQNDETQRERGQAFRALHERPRIFAIPNPWDAGSAKMLAALGFEALATTSAGFAFSLGKPDGEGAVDRDETLANARAIVDGDAAAGQRRSRERLRRRSRDVRARRSASAAEPGLVGGSIEDATGRADAPIYPLRRRGRARARGRGSRAQSAVPVHADGARREFPARRRRIFRIRSAGSWRSPMPAPTCSTRRACAAASDIGARRARRCAEAGQRRDGPRGRVVLARGAGRPAACGASASARRSRRAAYGAFLRAAREDPRAMARSTFARAGDPVRRAQRDVQAAAPERPAR